MDVAEAAFALADDLGFFFVLGERGLLIFEPFTSSMAGRRARIDEIRSQSAAGLRSQGMVLDDTKECSRWKVGSFKKSLTQADWLIGCGARGGQAMNRFYPATS